MTNALQDMGIVLGFLALIVIVLELVARSQEKKDKIKPFNPFNHE